VKPRRRLTALRDWCLFILIGLCLFHFAGQWRAPNLPDTAPDFALLNLDQELIQLSDFRGRPVILNFWATWCGPCRMEIPSFSAFADANPQIPVLGIAVDGTPEELRAASKDLGITYPILLGRKDVQATYGVSTLPTTVIIGPDGTIHTVHTGLLFRPQLEWLTRTWQP